MKCSWILGEDINSVLVEPDTIKSIASTWGSYTTWRKYRTENCICNDANACNELIQRAFHAVCNLYVPKTAYSEIGKPVGVKLFDDKSNILSINKDDLVSIKLATPTSDIVLLLGFNLGKIPEDVSEEDSISRTLYYNDLITIFNENNSTQFVLVDHFFDLHQSFSQVENLTSDGMHAVLQLLL